MAKLIAHICLLCGRESTVAVICPLCSKRLNREALKREAADEKAQGKHPHHFSKW